MGDLSIRVGDLAFAASWEVAAPQTVAAIRRMLPVRHGSRQTRALVYIARRGGEGTPRPGYVATVVEAARYWRLPEAHVRSLLRWSPSRWCGVRARDTGEVG